MQLYPLEGIVDNDDVINTYDVENNPSTPSKSETPSSSGSTKTIKIDGHEVDLQNDGDVNVIKVYMDAYVIFEKIKRASFIGCSLWY